MTSIMAAHVVVVPTSITFMIGVLAGQAFHRARATTRPSATPRNLDTEPLRLTVGELQTHGLRRWPNAPGIYFAQDGSVHCRRCITDPRIRAAIVAGRGDDDQTLVLFGGARERALVDANCSTHPPTDRDT